MFESRRTQNIVYCVLSVQSQTPSLGRGQCARRDAPPQLAAKVF